MRAANTFGGPWTEEKLGILERYLDAYTTALKNQSFKLLYIDAFAGTGVVKTSDDDAEQFITGSTKRAIGISDKPFDKLVFIERNENRYKDLRNIQEQIRDRNIQIVNADANKFLRNFNMNWKHWRGVLFLDPFATEVEWTTIETIADFEALDMWILFPTHAISRMLPTEQRPEDINRLWADRLDRIYGDDSWRRLYDKRNQYELFGDTGYQRTSGVDGLTAIYKENLGKLFGDRFLKNSKSLKNSRNSVLFEFLFCVGNKNGIGPATAIANHILNRL